jgi:RHS repeat-associated protein
MHLTYNAINSQYAVKQSLPLGGDLEGYYAFNAKELDEENNMYYYSARYYAPPTFISRDPLFEKYPSISPYTYCANNPLKYVDPTGETWVELEKGGFVYDSRVLNQKDAVKYYGMKANAIANNYSYKSKNGEVRLLDNGVYTVNDVKHKLQDKAGGLSKVIAGARKIAVKLDQGGSCDGANTGRSSSDMENKILDAVASVAQGGALINPLVSITNDVKTLTKGEDIYGNKATPVNKVVAGVDIVTFGGARAAKYIGQGTAKAMKWINRGTTSYSVGKTIYEEFKKK